MMRRADRDTLFFTSWLFVYTAVLVWSAIDPLDYFIWILEVFPALIGVVVIILTYRSFRLTTLLYILILLHCIILMVGGHYTYAEVPLFDRIGEFYNAGRNDYDKLGHIAQGFIPALIAREVLIRKKVVNGSGWLNFLILCIILSISACYEIVEWWVAEISGTEADAFLGTQGYVWDTQADMLFAILGAAVALILLGRLHDRQLKYLQNSDKYSL
jgi:putative membrane protein